MIIPRLLNLFLLALGLASINFLGSSQAWAQAQKPSESERIKIILKGSSTLYPLAKIIGYNFSKQRSVIVNVNGGGSSFGIEHALHSGHHIGMISRDLRESEMNRGLVVHPIAVDGIAIIINKENPLRNLTLLQIKKILTGKITSWEELGWDSGAQIRLSGPSSDHGTHVAFKKLSHVGGPLTKSFRGFISHRRVMKEVNSFPNAIAWVPLGHYLTYSHRGAQGKGRFDNITALKIEGIAPTRENLSNKSYHYRRTLSLLAKEKSPPIIDELIKYFRNRDSQDVIKQSGFLPY
ncbi:PBP family protein [Bacteriovorax sp. DB6_IX]|nr:PBP family protein [Bacteriovorax sp. DB6_IX]